jgi:hypothetical protein
MTREDGVRRWSRLRPYHLGKVRRHFHIHPGLPEQIAFRSSSRFLRGRCPGRGERSAFTSPPFA